MGKVDSEGKDDTDGGVVLADIICVCGFVHLLWATKRVFFFATLFLLWFFFCALLFSFFHDMLSKRPDSMKIVSRGICCGDTR